jgi:hypothetical protein
MPDLAVDYVLLETLSMRLRQISILIWAKQFAWQNPDSGNWITREDLGGGDGGLFPADMMFDSVKYFAHKWTSAVSNAFDNIDNLASLCESVAKAWFDQDAGVANQLTLLVNQMRMAVMQAEEDELTRYYDLLANPYIGHQYNEDGKLEEVTIPLVQGPPPGIDHPFVPYSNTSGLTSVVNDDGSTTVTVTGPGGITYSQNTSNTTGADGSVTTTANITTSDGSTEKVVTVQHPDGSATMTTTGSDGVVRDYTKSAAGGDFTQTGGPPPGDNGAPPDSGIPNAPAG